MNTSPCTIVRFTVTGSALDAVLARTTKRRSAVQDLEWRARETEDGGAFESPPLRAAEAAELRAVFADVEGVAEVDITGDYVVGYTTAPESFDGFGTLSVSVEGGERLVAIRKEHLNWQAARYASGIHRFRPAEPAAENVGAPPAEPSAAPVEANGPAPSVSVGTVVHMRRRARRYVVVRIETVGGTRRLGMIALSGSLRGCYPTSVLPNDVERDPDQTVAFTGAAALTLQRRYDDVRR